MGAQNPFYVEYLDQELRRRKSKNPAYSLRAFAAALEMDFSQLSKIVTRKIALSPEMADRISRKLSLDEETRRKLILSSADEKKCFSLNRVDSSLTDCHS